MNVMEMCIMLHIIKQAPGHYAPLFFSHTQTTFDLMDLYTLYRTYQKFLEAFTKRSYAK